MLYNIIASEPFFSFCVIYNCVTITMICDGCVIIMYNIILISSNLKFKIRKINENENKNKNK